MKNSHISFSFLFLISGSFGEETAGCGWFDFNCQADKVDNFFGLLFSDYPRNDNRVNPKFIIRSQNSAENCETLTCKITEAVKSGYNKIVANEENVEDLNFSRTLTKPSLVIKEKEECGFFSFCGMVKAYDSFKKSMIYEKPQKVKANPTVTPRSSNINTADLFNEMAIKPKKEPESLNFLEQSADILRNGVVTGRALVDSAGRVMDSGQNMLESVVALGKSKARNVWDSFKGAGDNMFFDAISVYNEEEEVIGKTKLNVTMTPNDEFFWFTTESSILDDEFTPRPKFKSIEIEESTEKYQFMPYEGSSDKLFTDKPYTEFPFENYILEDQTTASVIPIDKIPLDQIRLYK